MERRKFLEASVLATVFPFELTDSSQKGYWGFDGVREEEKLVFIRYNGRGEQCASCIISGDIGSWTVRKSVWGGQIRHSDEYSDRAEALEEAREWMSQN